jgi:hypothetical protein
MHNFPTFTTGHDRLHSCLHFFGRHRSPLTMAMRSSFSFGSSSLFFLPMAIVDAPFVARRRRRGRHDVVDDAVRFLRALVRARAFATAFATRARMRFDDDLAQP